MNAFTQSTLLSIETILFKNIKLGQGRSFCCLFFNTVGQWALIYGVSLCISMQGSKGIRQWPVN